MMSSSSSIPDPAKQRLKICILQSDYASTNSVFKDVDPYAQPERWLKDRHDCHSAYIKKATSMQQIRDLAKENYDVYINLCDGAWDEERAGLDVVQALERYNLPFTGACSAFYEPSKELMKMAAHYAGVRTPPFVFAFTDADIEEAATSLNYPLIVKHYNGYSSIGMTKDSRCPNAEQLRVQARKMIDAFGGALIEEFIDGHEFTVLVGENPADPRKPIAYVPVECTFPPGESFKHFDLKWVDYDGMQWMPVKDEKLANEIKEMGQKMFLALNGDSYARCDIRMDKQGRVFFLEINPYCGIFYAPETPGSADCILKYDPIGPQGFLDHLIRCAYLRQQRIKNKQKVAIRFKPSTGYGLVAARDIAEGEIVDDFEEKAHYLVTSQYVEKNWDEKQKEWFKAYAYPLIGDTYVMWSDKPTDWKPLNHCCDPNTWFVGLNQVARRHIKKGEAITMEYATFCGENMAPFECKCGASNCRKNVKPTDFLEPWVEEKYAGHIADYVRVRCQEEKNKKEHSHSHHHHHAENHNHSHSHNNNHTHKH